MLYQQNILYLLIIPFQVYLDLEQGWNPYETQIQTRLGSKTLNLDPEPSWMWPKPLPIFVQIHKRICGMDKKRSQWG